MIVRVEDARLVPDGGPAWLTVSGLGDPSAVASTAASAGGSVQAEDGRLRALLTPRQLVNAVGRVDAEEGRQLRDAVDWAVAAWLAPVEQVPAGSGRQLGAAGRPVVMGIVNTTPDSFSDGGMAYDPADHPARAIEHARGLVEAGADLIDVGGESTRPGAEPVGEEEELERVVPVVAALAPDVPVSIDTSKAAVARAAVEAGAVIVNDVSAGALDENMWPTVAELDCGYVLMHMQGTPRTMQQDPTYEDVVAEVYEFLAQQLERLGQAGVTPDRVTIDPGVGFGKQVEHNHRLLAALRQFASLGAPVMVGTSRKSFLAATVDAPKAADRVAGSVATATAAVLAGAAMVRVHDVAETRHAVDVARVIARA